MSGASTHAGQPSGVAGSQAPQLESNQIRPSVLPTAEIKDRLGRLKPEVPWNHIFDFGSNVSTLHPDQPRNFNKATGLRKIGRQILESVPFITRKPLEALSVLDLACAEGQHAIEFAAAGAERVLGVEGRDLYVDRARFVAEAYGLGNIEFKQGDVRAIAPADPGVFDLVLFFGILHHLDGVVFLNILKRLRSVTADTLVLYTHTSEAGCDNKFGDRLSEEREIEGGYRGRFYMEHPEHATSEQRKARVRNSLDNSYSFWARENSLIHALRDAGFTNLSKLMYPNPFGNPAGEFRVLYVCR